MISVTVTPQLKKVSNAFKDIKMGFAIQRGIEEYAFTIEREAKKTTPVDTGRLRASERTDISTLKAIVSPHTNYALTVHEGGRGRRPNPYMTRGMERAKSKLSGLSDPVLNEINVEINKHFKKL